MKLLVLLASILLATPAIAGEHLKELKVDPTRTIVFRGPVNEDLANATINKLVELDVDPPAPILIIINSRGGSVAEGFRMIAAMKATKSPIACVVDGGAYSMAAVLFEYCGKRYVQTYADLMFHRAAYGVSGNVDIVNSENRHFQALLALITEDIAFRMKLTTSAYMALTENEWWLTSKQAVNAGVADGTVDALKYTYTPPPLDILKLLEQEDEDAMRKGAFLQ